MEDQLVKLLAILTAEIAHYICMGFLLVKVLAIIICELNWFYMGVQLVKCLAIILWEFNW
jgi:hypothetical protein